MAFAPRILRQGKHWEGRTPFLPLKTSPFKTWCSCLLEFPRDSICNTITFISTQYDFRADIQLKNAMNKWEHATTKNSIQPTFEMKDVSFASCFFGAAKHATAWLSLVVQSTSATALHYTISSNPNPKPNPRPPTHSAHHPFHLTTLALSSLLDV